jgi:hypothetical protein
MIVYFLRNLGASHRDSKCGAKILWRGGKFVESSNKVQGVGFNSHAGARLCCVPTIWSTVPTVLLFIQPTANFSFQLSLSFSAMRLDVNAMRKNLPKAES